MSVEHQFVPMSEANTACLRTTATLPFHLHEEVGLNVKRIHAICQVSGFRHLVIRNDPEGERSRATPQVVGIDRNGSAVGGKVAFREVPAFKSDYTEVHYGTFPQKQARWKNVVISLNTQEITQRILHSERKVTDSDEWGKEINKALKKAMTESGTRHLVKDLTRIDLIFTLVGNWLIYKNDLIEIVKEGIDPQVALSRLALRTVSVGVIFTTISSLFDGVEKPGEGRRVSLLYGPELDRAVVLLALAYSSRLAKGISKDGKNNKLVRTNPRS